MNTASPDTGSPALIGLDWGTSSLRAYLFDTQGSVLAREASGLGVQKVEAGRFREAFEALCSGWLKSSPDLPVIASGMIGSQQGWRDAGYQNCPADITSLGARLCEADDLAGRTFRIVPGLRQGDAQGGADVMRGEETQILGLGIRPSDPPQLLVMPGTHSKWVRLQASRIESFRSFLTGELYEVIARHTIVGRLFPAGPAAHAPQAFEAGLDRILEEPAALSALLFSVRAQGVLGLRPAAELPAFLSGLLIGAELNVALAADAPQDTITLVGDAQLCERYSRALERRGRSWRIAPADLAAAGLFRLARGAGLLRDVGR